MIALHPTGCKLSSFCYIYFYLLCRRRQKKSFQRKKIFGQERFFWRKIVNFLFLTLGKTWVRERPNILRWVRRWRLRPRKHDPSEWVSATVVPPPRADNCKVRRTEERESEASPEQTTSEDRAGENQFHSWLHYWFIIIGCIIVLVKSGFSLLYSYISANHVKKVKISSFPVTEHEKVFIMLCWKVNNGSERTLLLNNNNFWRFFLTLYVLFLHALYLSGK